MATGWQIVICTLYTQYTHLYIVGFFGLALLFQLLLLCLKAKRFWLRLDCLESESIGGLDWIVKRQTIWLCLLCLYLCAFVSVGGRLCVCVGMDSVFFLGGLGRIRTTTRVVSLSLAYHYLQARHVADMEPKIKQEIM